MDENRLQKIEELRAELATEEDPDDPFAFIERSDSLEELAWLTGRVFCTVVLTLKSGEQTICRYAASEEVGDVGMSALGFSLAPDGRLQVTVGEGEEPESFTLCPGESVAVQLKHAERPEADAEAVIRVFATGAEAYARYWEVTKHFLEVRRIQDAHS